MKKKMKTISLILTLALALGGVGCETNEKKSPNAPDYSKSDKEYTIWAYSATCDDWYQVNGVRYYFQDGTRQTAEHTKLYADGGYNVLFVDWTFTYGGQSAEDFEKSETKRVMDLAHQEGLKCFIFVGGLHTLSSTKESLINPEKANGKNFFASQEELNACVAKCLAGIKDHPAFYGCSLVDEPWYTQFEAIGQVYRAIQAAAPNSFVNMNLNPMSYDLRALTRYSEAMADKYGQYVLEDGSLDRNAPSASMDEVRVAYKEYLEKYYEKIGKYCGYVGYDSYPLLSASTKRNYDTLKEHLENAQIVAEFCEQKDMRFGHVYQTYGNNSRRATTKTDMYWQANVGMAFGVKDHSYYTYYPTVNSGDLPDETTYIVNREGDPNERYYWLKDLHEEMQFNAKALMNFEYRAASYCLGSGYDWNDEYITRLVNEDLTGIEEISVEGKGAALVTEQYDEKNGQTGYYLMNVTDALETSEIKITLRLDGYDTVQVYNGEKVTEKSVKDGTVSFYLGTGRGVFIMPYNE